MRNASLEVFSTKLPAIASRGAYATAWITMSSWPHSRFSRSKAARQADRQSLPGQDRAAHAHAVPGHDLRHRDLEQPGDLVEGVPATHGIDDAPAGSRAA